MNKFYKTLITLVIMTAMFASTALANQKSLTREHSSILQSTRALGMGGVFYGMSNDKYAAFYNPAGLKDADAWNIDIVPITLGANDHLVAEGTDLVNELLGDSKKWEDATYVEQQLRKIAGDYITVDPVTFYPAFTKKNLSFGVFATSQVSLLSYNINVLPELAMQIQADIGATAAYAMQFLENDALSVGVSVKGFYRMGAVKSYTALDLANVFASSSAIDDLKKELEKDGTGIAILGTIGAMYDLPVAPMLKPRVALSINDFGYQNFGKLLDEIDTTVNASVSIAPSYSVFDIYAALEFVDMFFAGDDPSIWKRINLGAEVGIMDMVFLRGGFHQGYATAGAGLEVWHFLEVNYAYYTEELGAFAGQNSDKRHVIEFVIGF